MLNAHPIRTTIITSALDYNIHKLGFSIHLNLFDYIDMSHLLQSLPCSLISLFHSSWLSPSFDQTFKYFMRCSRFALLIFLSRFVLSDVCPPQAFALLARSHNNSIVLYPTLVCECCVNILCAGCPGDSDQSNITCSETKVNTYNQWSVSATYLKLSSHSYSCAYTHVSFIQRPYCCCYWCWRWTRKSVSIYPIFTQLFSPFRIQVIHCYMLRGGQTLL